MNIVLSLTDFCNLRCDYCYYRHNHAQKDSTKEIIAAAIDFFRELSQKRGQDYLNITFFGGEPLLKPDLIHYAIDYCESYTLQDEYQNFNFNFAINTNGTLFTKELLDYFDEKSVSIFLSLDGPEQAHDAARKCANREGSFGLIAPWLERLAKMNASLQKAILPETVESIANSVKFFLAEGFTSIVLTPDYSAPWTMEKFELLEKEYRKLAKLYRKQWNRGNYIYINLLEDKIKLHVTGESIRETSCNIGKENFAVSAQGDIFPCVRFVNNDKENPCLMGHVKEGFYEKPLRQIEEYHTKEKPQCSDCTIRERCMGNCCGCVAWSTTGALYGVSPFVCEHERMAARIADETGVTFSKRINRKR
ncbi:MAG: radical SAM protein [bacterium]|nr:radical SAM protein [bacterium]